MKIIAKILVNALVAILGSQMIDHRTGKRLGKVLAFSWRGRIRCIGLWQDLPLRPAFETTKNLRYWEQSIVFSSPEEVDFPNVRDR